MPPLNRPERVLCCTWVPWSNTEVLYLFAFLVLALFLAFMLAACTYTCCCACWKRCCSHDERQRAGASKTTKRAVRPRQDVKGRSKPYCASCPCLQHPEATRAQLTALISSDKEDDD